MNGQQLPAHSSQKAPLPIDADLALQIAPVGTWDFDIGNQWVWWDERCQHLYGVDQDEVIPYEQLLADIYPDDQTHVDEAVQWALNPASGGRYDCQFRTRVANDGQQRWLHGRGRAFFNDQGEAYRFFGTVQEVIPLVPVNQHLASSQAQFEDLVTATPVATAVFIGRDMLIQQVNRPMLAIWGKDSSVMGKTLHQAMPELEGQPFLAQLRHVFDTGEPFRQDEGMATVMENGQAKRVWFNHAYNPLHDQMGQIYGVINVAIDVTAQVLARQKIEESELFARTLFERSPIAKAVFVGETMVIQTANQPMLQMWGKEPSVIGKPFMEAVPELIPTPQLARLRQVMASGEPFYQAEEKFDLIRYGSPYTGYFEYTYEALRSATGTIYGVICAASEVTYQVLTRQKVEASEAHLQLLRDTVPAMIFYLDADQRYQSYNRVFREWFSVGDEVIGQTVREFIGEPAYQKMESHLAKAYAGQPEQYEMHAPNRMHADRWLSIVYTPHKTQEGRVIGVIVHATDITQRKQSEHILRESEARFRALIEEAPVATCLFMGREMRVDIANEQMLSVWGKNRSVLHKPLAEALPELTGQPFLAILDEVFTSGQAYSAKDARAELVVDGVLGTYYFDFTYKPLRNEAGQVYAIMNMATDVTQQVLARQQLLESQAALQNAIELAELGTWHMDCQTGDTYLSPRHADMFGLATTFMSLDQVLVVLHPDDLERVQTAFRSAQQPGSAGHYAAEYRIINARTGGQRHIRARGETRFDEQGRPVSIWGTAQDVTLEREAQFLLESQVQQRTQELQLANQDLQRSNDNLQQFAYVASHDLQEPLRKIQSFSTLISDHLAGQLDPLVQMYLERITAAGARMSTLMKDLLTYSRISTRQQAFGVVSLDVILSGVRSMLEWEIQQQGALIQVDTLPSVQGDETQLSQLFQNLLTNALKFVPPGQVPQVHIQYFYRARTELPPGVHPAHSASFYHQISVSDQGIGFDEKYLDRIFQVFQRLHGKNEFVGTGVGLAICQRVVENHGGAITARSQPGQGATFCIFLPA